MTCAFRKKKTLQKLHVVNRKINWYFRIHHSTWFVVMGGDERFLITVSVAWSKYRANKIIMLNRLDRKSFHVNLLEFYHIRWEKKTFVNESNQFSNPLHLYLYLCANVTNQVLMTYTKSREHLIFLVLANKRGSPFVLFIHSLNPIFIRFQYCWEALRALLNFRKSSAKKQIFGNRTNGS